MLGGDGTLRDECGVESGTALFRDRASILGDIVHGRPVYVGAPPAGYLFDNYKAFKDANLNRPARVYVGANDGMVHAFDAETGAEEWAYIPSMVLAKLSGLSSPILPFDHQYLVDGTMTAGDADFGTSGSPDWRTVLVGGLGAGGKGLFALDVTDANASTESAAKSKILWEIKPS